jgi:hypothetical protein
MYIDPVHPYRRALIARITELEFGLGTFLVRELNALTAQHGPSGPTHGCATCRTAYPCPPTRTAGTLLRVDKLHRAWQGAELLAAEARDCGANIFTVLRRHGLDSVRESDWSPPAHPAVELFGFELVHESGTIGLQVSGDTAMDLKQGVETNSQRGPAVIQRAQWTPLSWGELLRSVIDEVARGYKLVPEQGYAW